MDDDFAQEGGLAEPSLSFDWGEDEASEVNEPDVLRFELAGLSFAVEAVHVAEVTTSPTLTELPGLPDHIVGVAVRRRHVLSVLDLAVFFGLQHRQSASDRLIVFSVDGLEAGIVVSNIAGPEVWPEDADPVEEGDYDDLIRPYVIGARWAPGGRVLLLDIPELLHAAAVR